jgi:hypothetical protein
MYEIFLGCIRSTCSVRVGVGTQKVTPAAYALRESGHISGVCQRPRLALPQQSGRCLSKIPGFSPGLVRTVRPHGGHCSPVQGGSEVSIQVVAPRSEGVRRASFVRRRTLAHRTGAPCLVHCNLSVYQDPVIHERGSSPPPYHSQSRSPPLRHGSGRWGCGAQVHQGG